MIWVKVWPESTQKIHYVQATEHADDGASTLALKPMAGSTEVRNRQYQRLHKMVTYHYKKAKRIVSIKTGSIQHICEGTKTSKKAQHGRSYVCFETLQSKHGIMPYCYEAVEISSDTIMRLLFSILLLKQL